MNTIAVFRSRSQAISVYRILTSRKIACITVNAPAKYNVGCGIGIVFSSAYSEQVKNAIKTVHADTFVGFFNK